MPRSAKSPTSDPSSKSRAKTSAKTTPKAPVLKKAEVEAMLLSAQKKLHDAEVTLNAQAGELDTLRAQSIQLQTELDELRDAYYGGQVETALAHHTCQNAQIAEATAIAEVRHLTQLLAEQSDKKELEVALLEAEARFKNEEALQLRVAEQDQRLELTAREMADLTELLESTEVHWQKNCDAFKAGMMAGQAAVGALIEPPETMRLDQERLERAANALVESGAFDPVWYLEENKDVAEAGLNPALHFLEFGFAEGRSARAPQ